MALSDADRAALLGDIGFHWGDAYVIDFDDQARQPRTAGPRSPPRRRHMDHPGTRPPEMFTAHRIGYPEHVLMAETTVQLREAIRKDYFAWMAGLRERMST